MKSSFGKDSHPVNGAGETPASLTIVKTERESEMIPEKCKTCRWQFHYNCHACVDTIPADCKFMFVNDDGCNGGDWYTPLIPADYQAAVDRLFNAARATNEMLEHGMTERPNHICGPQSPCDALCENWIRDCETLEELAEALAALDAAKKEQTK